MPWLVLFLLLWLPVGAEGWGYEADPVAQSSYRLDGARVDGLPWERLESSTSFVMVLHHPQAEDALVACGYALARAIPSLYMAGSRKELPWFLREAEQTYPGLVEVLEGRDIPADQLDSVWASLRKRERTQGTPLQPRSLTRPAPETVDSFLGCLMSGLTEPQYAEAQSHLRAIEQALQRERGDRSFFCEGLNVSSTASFGSPRESLGTDLESLRKARNCVFYTYDRQSRPSGMWVELGAALAWKKPCLVLVPDLAALPPALRSPSRPSNLRVVVFGTHAELLQSLQDPDARATLFR